MVSPCKAPEAADPKTASPFIPPINGCAAGIYCTHHDPLALANSTHKCSNCDGRMHSVLQCGEFLLVAIQTINATAADGCIKFSPWALSPLGMYKYFENMKSSRDMIVLCHTCIRTCMTHMTDTPRESVNVPPPRENVNVSLLPSVPAAVAAASTNNTDSTIARNNNVSFGNIATIPTAAIVDAATNNSMAKTVQNVEGEMQKCKVKGCKFYTSQTPMITCDAEDCDKLVHPPCYQYIIDKSLQNNIVDGKNFHSLGCQKKYLKTVNVNNLNWTNDGEDGRNDPYSSQYFLLDWLNSDDNYSKWRDPPGATTKQEMATKIGKHIHSKGVRVKRTGEQVRSKIVWIEASMRQAFDFENSATGAGIELKDGVSSFKEAVMKHAPFYYDLKDVFTARASVQPKALSTNIGYDSSSDSDVNGSSGSISISSGEDDEVVDAGDSSDGDGNSFKTPKKNKSSSKKQSSKKKKKKRSSTTPSSFAKTPSSKKKPKKVKVSKKSGADNLYTGFDESFSYYMQEKTRQMRKASEKSSAGSKVDKMVALSGQFAQLSKNLESKIKAAYHCPEFVIFLSAEELIEYKAYKQEMDALKE